MITGWGNCPTCGKPIQEGAVVGFQNGQAWHYPDCSPKPFGGIVKAGAGPIAFGTLEVPAIGKGSTAYSGGGFFDEEAKKLPKLFPKALRVCACCRSPIEGRYETHQGFAFHPDAGCKMAPEYEGMNPTPKAVQLVAIAKAKGAQISHVRTLLLSNCCPN